MSRPKISGLVALLAAAGLSSACTRADTTAPSDVPEISSAAAKPPAPPPDPWR